MAQMQVPTALRERLGATASFELVEMVDSAGSQWRDDVLNETIERFQRRFTEEAGELRVEVTNLKKNYP